MTVIVKTKPKPEADRNEAPTIAAPRVEVGRPVVLTAHGLRKAFGGQVVLDGVDLELRESEVIILRGDNGSGKTTLINILTGNLEPDAGNIHYRADVSPREFRFPRRWWQELNPFDHFTPESAAHEGIGRMWQDVRLFSSQNLRDNIAVAEPRQLGENPIRATFTPDRCRLQEVEVARKADEMLSRVGLAGRELSSGDKISLGQSKRVAIARAVAAGARILFLDEPLSGLDRRGIADVLALLRSLVREKKVTLIVVEHIFNHAHLQELATADWLLSGGTISISKLRNSEPPPPRNKAVRPQWLSILAPENSSIVDEPLPNGAVLTRIRPQGFDPAKAQVILELRELVVGRGSRVVIGQQEDGSISGLNLRINEGERCILQAPNGWGKSTLFEALAGLVPLIHGRVLVAGRDISSLPAWKRAESVLGFFSSGLQPLTDLSIAEFFRLRGVPPDSTLSIPHSRTMGTLSGGQMRRVLLWAFLKTGNKSVALLDEPFSALDHRGISEFAALLNRANFPAIFFAEPIRN